MDWLINEQFVRGTANGWGEFAEVLPTKNGFSVLSQVPHSIAGAGDHAKTSWGSNSRGHSFDHRWYVGGPRSVNAPALGRKPLKKQGRVPGGARSEFRDVYCAPLCKGTSGSPPDLYHRNRTTTARTARVGYQRHRESR